MDTASSTPTRPRAAPRYRRYAQDLSPRPAPRQDGKGEQGEEEEERSLENLGQSLLIGEQRKRKTMGRGHRIFHHRQAEPSNVLTVPVEVVATIDDAGNTVIQETRTLPIADALPTVPAVPSVPPFPTDLVPPSVPAFPFPSGVPSPSLSEALTATELPATTLAPAHVSSAFPTLNPSGIGFNSTSTTKTPSSSLDSSASTGSTLSSSTTSLPSSILSSITSSTSLSSIITSSSSQISTTSTRISSSATSTTWTSSATPFESYVPGGGGFVGEDAPPASEPTEVSSSSAGSEDSTITTPRIVGSVIGSLAGTAILLWLILFLIKRHKRRGVLQLTDTADNEPIAGAGSQMASRSVPSFLNRFSGASRSTIDTSTGERGFQRISGRKLPSAFSEGMTSEQFARREGTLSGSSFYSDDRGFYGGPGLATHKEFGKEIGIGEASNYGTIGAKERIMPSPARTPVVHHPDDVPPWGTNRSGGGGDAGEPSMLSPPQSPNMSLDLKMPLKPSLGRSHPSHDGSRSSRFTENV